MVFSATEHPILDTECITTPDVKNRCSLQVVSQVFGHEPGILRIKLSDHKLKVREVCPTHTHAVTSSGAVEGADHAHIGVYGYAQVDVTETVNTDDVVIVSS